MSHIWNYFDTGHEKAEHDGVGACIKTTLQREEMKFTRNLHILDAKSIVQWCYILMSHGENKQWTSTGIGYVIRNLWEVVNID